MKFDSGSDGVGDEADLVRRLRREAARDRPAFSPDLQARIMAAVGDAGCSRTHRVAPRAAVLSAACCALLGVVGGLWLAAGPASSPIQPAPAVAAADGAVEPPPIDQVPLLDEIGTEILEETAAIAAEAVGLPRWNDLVDAGADFVAPGDDWSGTITR
jgi:hypothetical protein